MKRLSVLLVSAGLALFAVGCSSEKPAGEAEKQKMESDMQKMTQGLPTTPGAGQPAGGASETPTTE